MKKVSIINQKGLSAVIFSVLFLVLSPVSARDYDRLWREAFLYQRQNLPVSAEKVVAQIRTKALREKNMKQEMASFLAWSTLRQQVCPDSFYQDFRVLEQRVCQTSDSVEQMIYAAYAAELCVQNTYRGQWLVLPHQAELPLEYWRRQDYEKRAAYYFDLSLKHPKVLFRTRISDYQPLFEMGTADQFLGHDLLQVLGRRALQGLRRMRDADCEMHTLQQRILQVYRKEQHREGELYFMLDSIEHAPIHFIDGITPNEHKLKEYKQLMECFADVPSVAEVYLKAAQLCPSVSERVSILEEGVRRYPRYPRTALLRNELSVLQQPVWNFTIAEQGATGDTLKAEMYYRNINKVEVRWYRVTTPVQEKLRNLQVLEAAHLLRKQAVCVAQRELPLRSVSTVYDAVTDTLDWVVPDPGHYVALFTVSSKEGTRLHRLYFHASALKILTLVGQQTNEVEVLAVDARTGTPRAGVRLETSSRGVNNQIQWHYADSTDSHGSALLHVPQGSSYRIRAICAEDTMQTDMFYQHRETNIPYIIPCTNVYTDRAIYRSGQEVQLTGVVGRLCGFNYQVCADTLLPLAVYDATGKEVYQEHVRTDAWGTWKTTYRLPQNGTNGRYRVSVGHTSCTFSVEAYVRPRYELVLDQSKLSPLAWGDTLRLSGMVRQYNGAPSQACVVFSALNHHDTLRTDVQGRFVWVYPIGTRPLTNSPNGYHSLQIRCTSLYPSGEQSEQYVYQQIVTLKKNLVIHTNPIWEKTSATKVRFSLMNTKGEQLPATVFYYLYPINKGVPANDPQLSGKYIANKDFEIPTGREMTSGRYVLRATVVCDQDTLRTSRDIILYTRNDAQVPVDTTFWCRVLQSDFSEHHDFVCEIGSSEKDVTLYYRLYADGKIQEQKQLMFSDSLFALSIPYHETYSQGASLHLAMVKNNQTYVRDYRIECRRTPNSLRYKWHTFRDKLLPGSHQTWKLLVTDTLGKPVQARGLFTLYDASLDAIQPHSWHFTLPQPKQRPMPYWQMSYVGQEGASIFFPLKQEDISDGKWSDLNMRLLGQIHSKPLYSTLRKPLMQTNATADRMMAKSAGAAETAEEEVEESVEAQGIDYGVSQLVNRSTVRSNMQETAYFRADVQTDKQGMMHLEFDMPQALTRWRLLGLIYRSDLASIQLDTLVVTQQKLMAQLFVPAYLHQNDQAVIPVTLTNISKETDRGNVTLEITDTETNKVVYRHQQPFEIKGDTAQKYIFSFVPQKDNCTLVCRVLAEGKHHADGEQVNIRILPATVPVTYARPFVLDSAGLHRIAFSAPNAYENKGIKPVSCLIEYEKSPLFLALQVLPVLQTTPVRSTEDALTAYFATVTSSHLLHQVPVVQHWLQRWSDPQYIQKEEAWWKWTNQLNDRLWETTPWNQQYATAEKRLEALYQVNQNPELLLEQRQKLLDQLLEYQLVDGSFSWMPGMSGSVGVTLRVLSLMQALHPYRDMSVDKTLIQKEDLLQQRAFEYLKKTFQNRWAISQTSYSYLGEHELAFLSLAACYLGREKALTIPVVRDVLQVIRRDFAETTYEQKISVARVLHAFGYESEAHKCMQSVEEHLVIDSMGVSYFEAITKHASVSGQRMLMHLDALNLFRELKPQHTKLIQSMWRWVLMQKRIQGWDNNYLSACALQTLFKDSTMMADAGVAATDSIWLCRDNHRNAVPNTIDSLPVVHYVQPMKHDEVAPKYLVVQKESKTPTWGTAYLQFDIRPDQMVREQKTWGDLSVELHRMPDTLKVGDEWNTAYLIRVDQDYDYMFLRIHAAACCRPLWLTSGYRHMQGVGYYLSLEEESMLLYFDHLPKGNYVLEVPYQVQFGGTYLHGGAEFQSYYAPEFRTYMPGKRIHVEVAYQGELDRSSLRKTENPKWSGTQSLVRWGIPSGDYSGITALGQNLYAVVNDKLNAFDLWQIHQDSVSGRIKQVKHIRQIPLQGPTERLDLEAISWWPERQLIALASEQEQTVRTYNIKGEASKEEWHFSGMADRQQIHPNYGFESLTYDSLRQCFWTCPENNLRADGLPSGPMQRVSARIPLYQLHADGTTTCAARYVTDIPRARTQGKAYCFGVSDLCFLPEEGLFVLERELFVSKHYLRSWVHHNLYQVRSEDLIRASGRDVSKRKVASFRTRLNPFAYRFANYEGVCPGIRLTDGRQTLLLINDAQSGVGNRVFHLKDYLRVLVLPNKKTDNKKQRKTA